jgi:predicted transcriptional regulator
MRVIGSKQEQEVRSELIKSHKALFESNSDKRLLRVLKLYFEGMKTAYILN